jgi:S-DNA-T family DNA segregation ATPase FtsK/SpoIIIE
VRRTTVSRRLRECVGVALFAAALIWLIALATYDASDPVWFFTTGIDRDPANFVGRVGAFLAELSFQLAGYAAYLLPAGMIITGWHYFWCRTVDAALTKITGAVLLLACASTLFNLLAGVVRVGGKPFRAGGYLGEWLGGLLSGQLYRTGSVIVVLALTVLAIILSTQFSLGRFFASVLGAIWAIGGRSIGAYREWVDERRKEKERQEVFAKHTKKGTPPPEIRSPLVNSAPPPPEPPAKPAAEPRPPAAAPVFGGPKSFPPAKPPKVNVAPPLPLPDPEPLSKAPAERRKGDYQLPPLALLDAPRTQRKIDERELMESARLLEEKCREFAVEGSVVQIHPGPVVTTFEFKPDAGVKYSKITSLADDLCLAMQAESVLIDRIPGKIHRRHPDSQPDARADLAA